MDDEIHISRREFLKRFAVLSIASAGGISCLCVPRTVYGPLPEYGPPPVLTDKPVPVPEYGPPPVTGPVVIDMAYLDTDGSGYPLRNSTNVPLVTRFSIRFSNAMDSTSQEAVFLSTTEGGEVEIETVWEQGDALWIAPVEDLQPGTTYILGVTEAAKSVQGNALLLTETAQATFTTVE